MDCFKGNGAGVAGFLSVSQEFSFFFSSMERWPTSTLLSTGPAGNKECDTGVPPVIAERWRPAGNSLSISPHFPRLPRRNFFVKPVVAFAR
jgi:hypothetical protein